MLKKILSVLSYVLSYSLPVWQLSVLLLLMMLFFQLNLQITVPTQFTLKLGDTGNWGTNMEIGNPNNSSGWISDTGKVIHCRTIDIGAWDMQHSPAKPVAHGLGANYYKVINVAVFVTDDTGHERQPLYLGNNGADPWLLCGFVYNITTTDIFLGCRTGGYFDTAAYSGVVINRGTITFMYTE